jgi:hypothetical protein
MSVGIPLAQTSRDSLYRRSMPRAGEDVSRCVYVAVMLRSAVAAHPSPYSKVCDTSRPRVGQSAATRTDLGRILLVHFLKRRAMPNGLVRKHRSEGAPACIVNGPRHAGLGKVGRRDIPNSYVVELPGDAGRELVEKIAPRVCDAGVNVRGLTLLPGALDRRERGLKLSEVTWVLHFLSSGKGGEVLQAKVNADTTADCPRFRRADFDGDVQKPVAASVAREVRTVLDLRSWRQIAALEDPELMTAEAKSIRRLFDVLGLNWHPSKRLFAAISQKWPLLLSARLGVLLTHGADRTGMQTDFLATPCGEVVQVEASEPFSPPLDGVFLAVVAVIPDEVDRSRLFVQQPGQRLNAVSVREDHAMNFTTFHSGVTP